MRQKLERALLILALIAATLARPVGVRAGTNAGQPCNPTCLAQDNGSGTVDLPAQCEYTGNGQKMYIISGLPAGTQIDIDPVLSSYSGIVRTPGGSLGGESTAVQRADEDGVDRHWHAKRVLPRPEPE